MRAIIKFKKEKRLFLFTVSIIAIFFYLSLPLSIVFFPEEMSQPSTIFSLPWAWLYAFFQVIMTWIFGWIYWIKSKHLDKLINEIKKEAAK